MAKYDIENLVWDIKDVVKDNLNTKLAALVSEKGDGVELGTVSDDAYFVQTLSNKKSAYSQFVFVHLENLQAEGERGGVRVQPVITVVIVFSDQQNNEDTPKKMFRYERALREVIQENFSGIGNSYKLRVSSTPDFNYLFGSETHHAVGVNITTEGFA